MTHQTKYFVLQKSDDNNSFVSNKSHNSSSNADGSPFLQPTLPIRNGNGSMDAYKVHINVNNQIINYS